jgi:hypothetical protein
MYAANDSGNDSGSRLGWRHALGGLEAGVLGALAMLACLMVGSLWDHKSIWVVPNLFATTFYGSNAYRNQLLRTTWSGVALVVAVYGILGILWGCVWRDERKPWLALYGAILGLAVYFVFYDFMWKHANPLVVLYAPDRQLQLGHVLWGMILARAPGYSRRIAQASGTSEAHDSEVEEIRSGEVIR